MLFPTSQFLVFFMIVFLIAIFLKRFSTLYKYYLLIISLIFYAFFDYKFVSILVLTIVGNYIWLKTLQKFPSHPKRILAMSLMFNLGILGIFKYFNFFIDSIYAVLHDLNIQKDITVIQIFAPVGISFYIFRSISHLVDYYRKQIEVPSFVDFATYISFFPQIAAGPITRAKDFYKDLNNLYDYDQSKVILLIISGLIKKLVISSFLFDIVQAPFSAPDGYSSLDLIFASLAYSCMIYTDFSGYSDLAIAISNLLGFNPGLNFNLPYRAKDLQEFWKRWHISLSTWLKDYLYIPLGGNQKGLPRKYLNLIITMLLAGLWHGAGINFIIWGGLHGIALALSHLIKDNFRSTKIRITGIFTWFITFTFVTLAWIFFNTQDLDTALKFYKGIFAFKFDSNTVVSIQLIAIILLTLIGSFTGEKISTLFMNFLNKAGFVIKLIFLIICGYLIFHLGPDLVPPFVYFNF